MNSADLWYCIVHYPEDACGTNMLGVLLELCNLNKSAVDVSKNALQCVTDETDIVRSNLGRQLRKIAEYKDAIEIYEGIKQTDFSTQCDLALTTFLGNDRHGVLCVIVVGTYDEFSQLVNTKKLLPIMIQQSVGSLRTKEA